MLLAPVKATITSSKAEDSDGQYWSVSVDVGGSITTVRVDTSDDVGSLIMIAEGILGKDNVTRLTV